MLPNRIREERKRKRLSLKVLAKTAGCSFPHVAHLEKGEREVSIHWLREFGRALDIPAADLLNLEDGGLSLNERYLIDCYRGAGIPLRAAIDAVCSTAQMFRSEDPGRQDSQVWDVIV